MAKDIKCPNCGGPAMVSKKKHICKCPYCGSEFSNTDTIIADIDKTRLRYGLWRSIFANEDNFRILVGFILTLILLGLVVAGFVAMDSEHNLR